MKAFLQANASGRIRGFTLMELLIVIVVIAILSAIAFPAYRAVQIRAVKILAKNEASQLVNAITTYRLEYGRYPLPEISPSDPEAIESDAEFMSILLGVEGAGGDVGPSEMNPRAIVFFEGREQGSGRGGGFNDEGEFLDPWGTMYEIYIDGNYDDKIEGVPGEDEGLRKPVVVRSAGPDKEFSDGENGDGDDVRSWE